MADVDEDIDLGPGAPLGGDSSCAPSPLSLTETLEAALSDARALPAEERRFLRYVSAGQFRPGSCRVSSAGYTERTAVDRARVAVNKLVNSLSREANVVVPQQVGPEGLLLRLDLRDYGWQRAVTVAGEAYPDVWEAFAGRAALALVLQGGTASELTAELGTNVPFLLSSSFVATGVDAELYYGVLRLPQTLPELQRELGLDGDQGLEQGPWARAAFSTSGVSTEPRGVARYLGTALGSGYFWQSFERAPSASSSATYLDPLATAADGHMVLFSLPNGVPAYFVSDGSGQRLAEARYLVDPSQNNGRMRLPGSCFSCHRGGIITFTDAVRPFVEDNADLFSEADLARVRDTFLLPEQMQALMDADSARIAEALERTGQQPNAGETVGRVALDYELALGFDQLAGELFLERADLIALLPRLPEPIAAAATSGSLERTMFESLYLQAACAVYGRAPSAPAGCR